MTWEQFFNWLMIWEGKTVHNDPRDPGGQTAWGISRRYWPGLTRRGTRIIRDALMGFETVIDADVSELFKLRSVFNNQAPE